MSPGRRLEVACQIFPTCHLRPTTYCKPLILRCQLPEVTLTNVITQRTHLTENGRRTDLGWRTEFSCGRS